MVCGNLLLPAHKTHTDSGISSFCALLKIAESLVMQIKNLSLTICYQNVVVPNPYLFFVFAFKLNTRNRYRDYFLLLEKGIIMPRVSAHRLVCTKSIPQ